MQAIFAEVIKPDTEPLLVSVWRFLDELFDCYNEMFDFISWCRIADVQHCPYGPSFPHSHIINGSIHQLVTGNRYQGIVEGAYAGTTKPMLSTIPSVLPTFIQ